MSNKTKRNHYVSRALSRNFRKKDKTMWILDCKTGIVSNKKTSDSNLFMKKNSWSQSVESSFGKLENDIMPLIKEIIYAPRNRFTHPVCIEKLGNKYNYILKYIYQTILFKETNTSKAASDEQEFRLSQMNEMKLSFSGESFLIRYNSDIFRNQPLILPDNVFSCTTMPCKNNLGYTPSFFMPISPYHILFFGKNDEVQYFVKRHISPHSVNLYKVLIEEKLCKVASSNRDYLEWFSKEYPHYEFSPNSIKIKSSRF